MKDIWKVPKYSLRKRAVYLILDWANSSCVRGWCGEGCYPACQTQGTSSKTRKVLWMTRGLSNDLVESEISVQQSKSSRWPSTLTKITDCRDLREIISPLFKGVWRQHSCAVFPSNFLLMRDSWETKKISHESRVIVNFRSFSCSSF